MMSIWAWMTFDNSLNSIKYRKLISDQSSFVNRSEMYRGLAQNFRVSFNIKAESKSVFQIFCILSGIR